MAVAGVAAVAAAPLAAGGATQQPAATANVKAKVPIVFVMMDEVSTISFEDARSRIDPKLYPNLASLARDIARPAKIAAVAPAATAIHITALEAPPP